MERYLFKFFNDKRILFPHPGRELVRLKPPKYFPNDNSKNFLKKGLWAEQTTKSEIDFVVQSPPQNYLGTALVR